MHNQMKSCRLGLSAPISFRLSTPPLNYKFLIESSNKIPNYLQGIKANLSDSTTNSEDKRLRLRVSRDLNACNREESIQIAGN